MKEVDRTLQEHYMTSNILYTGDNLYFLNGMNSESVDLIYLDPPFNSKRTYSAPVGSKSAGASFKDMWTWQDIDEEYLDKLLVDYPNLVGFIQSIQEIHGKAMMSYITYMTQRIIELHRVLKSTGSLYLHCDPTASHYLKIVLDRILGVDNFKNDLVWKRGAVKGAKATSKQFGRNIENLFFYTKSKKYTFNQPYRPYDLTAKNNKFRFKDDSGRIYSRDNPLGDYSQKSIKRFENEGRIYVTKTGKKQLIRYLDETKGVAISSVWDDIHPINQVAKERTGYPTQKPLKLLERIIKASSNEDDIVLDPFAGCATTCVAAQQLKRRWIGIDIEYKAVEMLMDRLKDDAGLFKDFIQTNILPERNDITIETPSTPIKKRLYEEQKSECNGCDFTADIQHFEIDHIIPKSKGGADTYSNYQLLCANCNRIKGNKPMDYLRIKIKKRQDSLEKLTFGL